MGLGAELRGPGSQDTWLLIWVCCVGAGRLRAGMPGVSPHSGRGWRLLGSSRRDWDPGHQPRHDLIATPLLL